ncbi:MAG: 50S ribosome-binding GTPase [Sedimentisphaerales bacterium]|nr:50S ribosome-binding GTPase [Sedimentisphaerales bacterium]
MYNTNDTIVAVSSPSNDHRVIVRISGSGSIDILNQLITPKITCEPGITSGKILNLDCLVYLFRQPHSYTGDDLAEIHLWANAALTEHLFEKLLSLGARPAAPGEFTARAYFNNKIDLAQAEAVNEVITASNAFQLTAAENLLAGRFGQTTGKIMSAILDLLSRLEADLDFSAEDIEPANEAGIISSLTETTGRLRELLAGSVRCESTIDLPSVAIAGSTNAGKSTLLNKLLGRQRSIVSDKRKTTRDVLTGDLTIHNCRCVLFDCAGLITHCETILDELAQQAAIGALKNAIVVIFCVDIAKPDWSEDLAVLSHCERSEAISLIPLATKSDLLCESEIAERTSKLKSLFGCEFLPISAHTSFGLEKLKSEIADRLITATSGLNKEGIALTSRHKQAITAAIADLEKAVDELKAGSAELAAMMLRTAHSQLSHIEQHNIDDEILDRIFSRFCIGK